MTIRIDLSALTRGIDIERIAIDRLIKDTADKIAIDLHAGLVLNTPVDSGRARAGWTVDTASQNPVIENNVAYIGVLNSGSSKQSPAGFVEAEIDKATKL